ncbi:hypothetical protein Leryth_026460, partial [Lithospermum erythrorhizon]
LNNLKPPPDFNSTIANCQITLFIDTATPHQAICMKFSSRLLLPAISTLRTELRVETVFKIDLHNQRNAAKLYLSFTFLLEYCPLSITTIDLSNNSIQGNFPSDIFTVLKSSTQWLIRRCPIQNFSTLSNLTFLNLSYNYFSEVKFHNELFFSRFNSQFHQFGILPDTKFKMKAVFLLFGFPVLVIMWRELRKFPFTRSIRDGNEVRIEMYKERPYQGKTTEISRM